MGLVYYLFLYTLTSKGPPPVQFPGRARPPTSFGAPPGAPSAPGAPSYPSVGFSNAPPTSFGMPQPYSQAPYPTHPTMHLVPGSAPAQTNTYPSQQMPYPQSMPTYPQSMPTYSQSMPTYPQSMPTYPQAMPSNTYSNQSAPSPYPRQQNYDTYPNLQTAPDAKEYFSNVAPSPYSSGPNTHTASSVPYQSRNPGGQGVSSKYPYAANPPTAAMRDTTPAPRRDRFTPKVRLRIVRLLRKL